MIRRPHSVGLALGGLVLASLLMVVGALVLLAGVIRLGWMRHGAAVSDLRFLHLDWVLRPELPYWLPHMLNLATLLLGLMLVAAGLWLAITLVRRARR